MFCIYAWCLVACLLPSILRFVGNESCLSVLLAIPVLVVHSLSLRAAFAAVATFAQPQNGAAAFHVCHSTPRRRLRDYVRVCDVQRAEPEAERKWPVAANVGCSCRPLLALNRALVHDFM